MRSKTSCLLTYCLLALSCTLDLICTCFCTVNLLVLSQGHANSNWKEKKKLVTANGDLLLNGGITVQNNCILKLWTLQNENRFKKKKGYGAFFSLTVMISVRG